jgi:hypothetical protein
MQPAPPEEQDVLDRPISTLVPGIEAGKSVAHWQQIFEEAEIMTVRVLLNMNADDLVEVFADAKEPFKKASMRAIEAAIHKLPGVSATFRFDRPSQPISNTTMSKQPSSGSSQNLASGSLGDEGYNQPLFARPVTCPRIPKEDMIPPWIPKYVQLLKGQVINKPRSSFIMRSFKVTSGGKAWLSEREDEDDDIIEHMNELFDAQVQKYEFNPRKKWASQTHGTNRLFYYQALPEEWRPMLETVRFTPAAMRNLPQVLKNLIPADLMLKEMLASCDSWMYNILLKEVPETADGEKDWSFMFPPPAAIAGIVQSQRTIPARPWLRDSDCDTRSATEVIADVTEKEAANQAEKDKSKADASTARGLYELARGYSILECNGLSGTIWFQPTVHLKEFSKNKYKVGLLRKYLHADDTETQVPPYKGIHPPVRIRRETTHSDPDANNGAPAEPAVEVSTASAGQLVSSDDERWDDNHIFGTSLQDDPADPPDLGLQDNGDLSDADGENQNNGNEPNKRKMSDGAYEVETLLEKSNIEKRVHYLVKWKNFGEEENSWEPRAELIVSAQDQVKDFEKKRRAEIAQSLKAQEDVDKVNYEKGKSQYERFVASRINYNKDVLQQTLNDIGKTPENATINSQSMSAATLPINSPSMSAATLAIPSLTPVDTPSCQPTGNSPVQVESIEVTPPANADPSREDTPIELSLFKKELRAKKKKRDKCSPAVGSPPLMQRKMRSVTLSLGPPAMPVLTKGDIVLAYYGGQTNMEALKATVVEVNADGTSTLSYHRDNEIQNNVLREHIKVSREKLYSSPDQ